MSSGFANVWPLQDFVPSRKFKRFIEHHTNSFIV